MTDSPERARLLATLCSELNYHSPLERRLALADEAKAMARRLGDRATFVDVVSTVRLASQRPFDARHGVGGHRGGIGRGPRPGRPRGPAFWLPPAVTALAVRAGQFELARERLATVRAMAEKLAAAFVPVDGQLLATPRSPCCTATPKRPSSSPPRRSRWARQADSPTPLPSTAVQLMGTRDQQGRLGELVSLIADVAEQNPAIPAYRAVLAAAHLDAGNEEAARELVDEGAADSFALPEDIGWFDGMVNYARVVIELRLRAHCEPLIKLLAPFRDQVPHNGLIPQPPVATFLGGLATVVDRFEEAESYFEEAAELNTRGEMKFAEAYTNMLWGRMLRTRNGPGDADRARELLEQARESAAARGYAMVERQANAELSKLS